MWADFPKFKHRKQAIYRGPGGSGDATDDAANAAELIIQKTDEAAAYAASASTSATNAAASAASAASSASGVSSSAAAAAASAAAALVSETNAASSASSASSSASSASSSASTATTKASEASASASSASSSASSASTSASNAATSASSASSSASSASSSASNASTSAGNAAISASNAASSATTAAGYVPSVTGNNGKYLRTNGTSNYWDTVDALPSQTSNSGKFLTTNGTTASWAVISGATPTDDGLVYGLTDAGTYYPPATVAGTWFDNPTATSIYTNISGDYNGQTGPGNIISKASDGTIAVGKTLIIEMTSVATSSLVQVNAGTITNIVIEGGSYGITITFSNSINWNDYVHTGVIFNYKLIVNSLILSGNKAENAILGYNAGNNITTGGENVIVGSGAATTLTEGRNNIIIGNAAEPTSATTSNEVTIGSTAITKTRLRGAILVGNSSPSAGTSGQVLTSNGSSSEPSWTTLSTGTVTSVALTAPTGLTVSGSPVTTSGTLALSLTAGYSIPTTASQTNWDSAYTDRLKWDGGATGLVAATGRTSLGLVIGTDIPSVSGSGATGTWGISITGNATNVTGTVAVANGGTGATTASGARTNLGLVIGTDVPSPTGTGASGTWGISVTGNAATVTNGLYSTGSYSDPTWLTTLAGSKITGTINGGTY